MTTEERILDAAAPMESKRFLFTVDADSNKTSESSSDVLDGTANKVGHWHKNIFYSSCMLCLVV